jgi:predicted phage tail protein
LDKEETKQRDRMIFRLYLKSSPDKLSEDELAYFREHPDMIDEVTAPVGLHKLFLWLGAILGALLVGVSKWIKFMYHPIISEGMMEFWVDIVFEIGVALIGAAVTAYILEILLNKQQKNAAHWRTEIRRKIKNINKN